MSTHMRQPLVLFLFALLLSVAHADEHPALNTASWLTGGPGAGFVDGPPGVARLNRPGDLSWGPDGALYVVDRDNHAVRRVTAEGVTTTLCGGRWSLDENRWIAEAACIEGTREFARLCGPLGICSDDKEALFVMDRASPGNHEAGGAIRRVLLDGTVSTFARGEGLPRGRLSRDPSTGAVYSSGGSLVWKTLPDGRPVVVCGVRGEARRPRDGKAQEARLQHCDAAYTEPQGIAWHAGSGLLIADFGVLRRLSPDGELTTVAGGRLNEATGDWHVIPDFVNGGPGVGGFGKAPQYAADALAGKAKNMAGARYIAVAGDGTVYVACEGNPFIRVCAPDGNLSTLVTWLWDDGQGAYTPSPLLLDREGNPALFPDPCGLLVGVDNALYVSDASLHAVFRVELAPRGDAPPTG